MSKILQGISDKNNVDEGKRGAAIGALAGYGLPDVYNTQVADRFGAPRVEPRQEKAFKAPEWSPILPGQDIPVGELNDVTTLGGAWLGHKQQKGMAAKKGSPEAQRIQQSLNQPPTSSDAPRMPRVGDPKPKLAIPDVSPGETTKLQKLGKLGKGLAILTALGYGGYKLLAEPALRKAATPEPGNDPDNPVKDCDTLNPTTGKKPQGCIDEMQQKNSNILEGLYLAEKNWKQQALDYVSDLYRKSRGQTTTKDVDTFLKQHGNEPASVIVKPSRTGGINAAEPITFNDVAGWEKLSKAQQKTILDKLGTKLDGLTRNQQKALIATLVPAAVGTVGTVAKLSTDAKYDKLVSDLEAERNNNQQLGPGSSEKKERQAVHRIETPKIDEPTADPQQASDVAPVDVAPPAPAETPTSQGEGACVVNGETLDLSPEECNRWREMSSTNESLVENTSNLISMIARANKLADPNLIRIGQKLQLPGNQIYTVRPGDNLTKIAKALLSQPSQSEPMQTVTVSTPSVSQKYPDSGLQPGQKFVDPRNNPGNLRFYKNLNQPGYVLDKAIGVDKNGFAVFATPEDGLDAMRRQIAIDARKGLTGRQFIAKYAPAADRNDPEIYTKNVFGELGLDPDQPLDPKLIPLIQPLMIRQEHGKEGMYYYMPQTDPRNRVAGLNEMEILQRFLDKKLNNNEKPVANPNAVPKKPTEPKEPGTTDYSKELELDPSFARKHPLELERPKVDAEVQKRMQQLQKQKPVPENKFDAVKKVIGAGRYIVFNPNTGLRLQTNDVNKAVNAAQLMAKKDLDRPTMVYDTQTKFPVAAYRGSEDMYMQRDIRHESKEFKKK